jgi:uncharacterized protein YcfL
MKNRYLILPTLLLVLGGAGCSSTKVNTLEPAQTTAQRNMLSDKRVLMDQSLSKSVSVIGVNTAQGSEGFLKIQVEVQNLTRKRRFFSYRVEWFDENGMLIELPSNVSHPRSIESKAIAVITATAPTPRARDFRIQFIEPTK